MKALFLLADIPGVFVPLVARLARRLRVAGIEPVFALTSPYYERFHRLTLAELGSVAYLSDYLASHRDETAEEGDFDYWATYPTFVRQKYFFGRHLNRWSTYRAVGRFFAELLDRHSDVGFLWSEAPSNAFLYLAHSEAARRSLPYYGYMSARIPGCFNIHLDIYGERMVPLAGESAAERMAGTPDYMKNPLNLLGKRSVADLLRGPRGRLGDAVRAGRDISLESGRTFGYQLRAYRHFLARKWRYRRVLAATGLFDPGELESGRVNILFPLQYRPEASTSVLARYFGDDLELIKNIAFSLPARAVLYVKEHVSAVGLRDADFYREIASYPNVRVLHPDYPLAERLAGFDAVITLASTVGFEALQLGIPVLLLGRVFYGDRPGVTRVESFRQLDELVGSLTPNVATPSDAALNWYRSFCFPGSFNYLDPAALTDANIDKLAAPLLRMHARHAAS